MIFHKSVKRYTIRLLFSSLVFISLQSCSDTTDPQLEIDESKFDYVLYDNLTTADISQISENLEINGDRILSDLKVTNMPKVTIKVWADYNHQDNECKQGGALFVSFFIYLFILFLFLNFG